MSVKCGHCQNHHQTVADVKACSTRTRGIGDVLPQEVPGLVAAADVFRRPTNDAERAEEARQAALVPTRSTWAAVDALRTKVAEHLHYETKQGGTTKRVGHFAVRVDGSDNLKFLRVKKVLSGKHAGRVFVDSMGSDTGYPVKAPGTLTMYLNAVLADPDAAAKRYADELGQCSDCGRDLTNEESRRRGIGPDCWDKRSM